jgi:hypothetical protein
MKVSVPATFAFALSALWAATGVNAGPCARDKSRNCFDLPATINFSSVSEISNQIVGEEKIKPPPLKDPAEDATPTPYTGPIIGANPRPGKSPTVGYHWSLE